MTSDHEKPKRAYDASRRHSAAAERRQAVVAVARETFEQAQRTERETIARLVGAAKHLLTERGGASATTLEQIAASLHAAAVSEHGRDVLATGRFTEPLTLEGFNAVAGLAPSPSKRVAKPKPSRSTDEMKQARTELADARTRLRAAERAAHEAHRRAAQADAELDEATDAVRRAEKKLRP